MADLGTRSSSKRRGRLVLGGAVGAVVAVVVGVALAIGGGDESDLVTYGRPEFQTSDQWSEEASRLVHDASGFTDTHDADFLGVYVNADGRVVIVTGTPAGEELAEKRYGDSAAVIEHANVSSQEAGRLGEELRGESESLDRAITAWGGDPTTLGMYIGVEDDLSAADRDTVEKFAESHDVPIRVETGIGRAQDQ